MIIQGNAPTRISLFGGSTDLPEYYLKHGGIVISMAINLRSHVTLFTDKDIYEGYTELPEGTDKTLCFSILKKYEMDSLHHSRVISEFDGVIGAGLGSSASFSIALLSALKKNKGERVDRSRLASEAYFAEKAIGYNTGVQDQYAASYGGFNIYSFNNSGVEILNYSRDVAEHIQSYMVLYYMGGQRESSGAQIARITPKRISHLNKIKDIALIGQKAISDGRTEIIGKLLHASWEEKKLSNKVSTPFIDQLYERGRKNGALGGKLLGAGGCGYMMFWVSPEKQKDFKNKMNIDPIDFGIDYTGGEARIL